MHEATNNVAAYISSRLATSLTLFQEIDVACWLNQLT